MTESPVREVPSRTCWPPPTPFSRHSVSGSTSSSTSWSPNRLLPVCAQLLDVAVEAGDIGAGTQPYELTRGVGNLCIGRDNDPRYDPRRLIALLLQGLQQPQTS